MGGPIQSGRPDRIGGPAAERPAKLRREQQPAFCARLDGGLTPCEGTATFYGRDIQQSLEKEFGVLYTLDGVYKLLHRLGYSCLKPRPRHEKADPAVQEAFKKNTPDKLEAIAQAHRDKRIEPWFEDEARFGQQGTVARVWARRGSRPRAVKQTGYEWLYVSAAVCPASGESVGLLSPYMDSQITNVFLRQMSQQLPPEVHAVLRWDQAGFHTSKALKVPPNISLIELSAYSPELNPVEPLRQFLRSHYWANRRYENYDQLPAAACAACQAACLDPEWVRSVCH